MRNPLSAGELARPIRERVNPIPSVGLAMLEAFDDLFGKLRAALVEAVSRISVTLYFSALQISRFWPGAVDVLRVISARVVV